KIETTNSELHPIKIPSRYDIDNTISVEVAGSNSEYRGKLRFQWQGRERKSAVTIIKKNTSLHNLRLMLYRIVQLFPREDVVHGLPHVAFVFEVLLYERRDLAHEIVPQHHRIALVAFIPAYNLFDSAILVKVIHIHAHGPICRGFKPGIQAMISQHEIGIAITVEVGGYNPVPPAMTIGQSRLIG